MKLVQFKKCLWFLFSASFVGVSAFAAEIEDVDAATESVHPPPYIYAALEAPLSGGKWLVEGGLNTQTAVIRRDATSGGLGNIPQFAPGAFVEASIGTGTHWMPNFAIQSPDMMLFAFSVMAFQPYVGLEAGVRWVGSDEGDGPAMTLRAGFAPRTEWEYTAYRLSSSMGVVSTLTLLPSPYVGRATARLRGPVRTWGGGRFYVLVGANVRLEDYRLTTYLQDGSVSVEESTRFTSVAGGVGLGYVGDTGGTGFFRLEPALGFERMRTAEGWTTWPAFTLRMSLGRRTR